jgi:hypothetical protein
MPPLGSQEIAVLGFEQVVPDAPDIRGDDTGSAVRPRVGR